MIDWSGGQPDPEKISAIQAMKSPTNISEMRRFLGRGLPAEEVLTKLADLTQPLCVLLSKQHLAQHKNNPLHKCTRNSQNLLPLCCMTPKQNPRSQQTLRWTRSSSATELEASCICFKRQSAVTLKLKRRVYGFMQVPADSQVDIILQATPP